MHTNTTGRELSFPARFCCYPHGLIPDGLSAHYRDFHGSPFLLTQALTDRHPSREKRS